MLNEQKNCRELGLVYSYLIDKSLLTEPTLIQRVTKLAKDATLHDGLLMKYVGPRGKPWESELRFWKVWVPVSLRPKTLEIFHSSPTSGHFGIRKTYKAIEDRCYWRSLRRDVTKFIYHCTACQQTKIPPKSPPGFATSPIADAPWELLSIDLMGPYTTSGQQKKYIFVVLDYFSKWVEIFPIRSSTTNQVITRLWEVFFRWGLPKALMSDRGSQFTSHQYLRFCSNLNIKVFRTTAFHPQSNAVEAYNKTIKTIIITTTERMKDWDKCVKEIALAIHSHVNESTQFTPAYLNFGHELRTPYDKSLNLQLPGISSRNNFADRMTLIRTIAKENIIAAQEQYQRYYNERHSKVSYKVGDSVMLRTHLLSNASKGFTASLAPRYEGPYTIKALIANNIVELDTPTTRQSRISNDHHVCKLKPCSSDSYVDPDPRRLEIRQDEATATNPGSADQTLGPRPFSGPEPTLVQPPQPAGPEPASSTGTPSLANVSAHATPFVPSKSVTWASPIVQPSFRALTDPDPPHNANSGEHPQVATTTNETPVRSERSARLVHEPLPIEYEGCRSVLHQLSLLPEELSPLRMADGEKLPPVKKLSVPKSFRLQHYWSATLIQTEPSLSTDIIPATGVLGNSRSFATATDPVNEIEYPSMSEVGQFPWDPSQIKITISSQWASSSRSFYVPSRMEPESRVLPLLQYQPPKPKGLPTNHLFSIISVISPTICHNGRSTDPPTQIPILFIDGVKAKRAVVAKQALRHTQQYQRVDQRAPSILEPCHSDDLFDPPIKTNATNHVSRWNLPPLQTPITHPRRRSLPEASLREAPIGIPNEDSLGPDPRSPRRSPTSKRQLNSLEPSFAKRAPTPPLISKSSSIIDKLFGLSDDDSRRDPYEMGEDDGTHTRKFISFSDNSSSSSGSNSSSSSGEDGDDPTDQICEDTHVPSVSLPSTSPPYESHHSTTNTCPSLTLSDSSPSQKPPPEVDLHAEAVNFFAGVYDFNLDDCDRKALEFCKWFKQTEIP
ncbi:unnamed protein product [Allacma fusca]|uniref:RNA-directed DNA polymerase n=1 Tax=Allacma fusca TaxID=39272 RepID=A0A8J2PSL6_9HEXA|nr:unnamed protein product [Allacma fusca]